MSGEAVDVLILVASAPPMQRSRSCIADQRRTRRNNRTVGTLVCWGVDSHQPREPMTMRKLAKLTVLAVLLTPAFASAQVSLGVRFGYGFAMGEFEPDVDLADGIKAQVPIQLDLGFHVSPSLTLGGYFSYGFGRLGDELEDCDDCSARVYRVGAQLEYTFKSPSTTPWIGAGIGYEWASLNDDAADQKLTYKGWEFLNLQGGVDWKAGEKFWLGPFAMVSVGQFSKGSFESPDGNIEVDISDKSTHEWIQIGVRGKFDL
jgi:hypothetical protein